MNRSVLMAILCYLHGVAMAEPNINWQLLPGTRPSGTSEVARGAVVFQSACAVCHGAGPDRPGTSSLELKYRGRLPALLEERTDLTAPTVLYFIRNGIAMMPQFRKTELNDADAAAIAAYLSRKRLGRAGAGRG